MFVVLTTLTILDRCCLAADEFQDLVNKIPRSANAVVLLNMEKAKSSPLGMKEDWRAKVEQAFEYGLVRVPPQAKRFVLASQIDFEFMEPLWEAAVIEMEQDHLVDRHPESSVTARWTPSRVCRRSLGRTTRTC